MQVLRKGSKGSDVVQWQQFLLGQGLYVGAIDGDFGPITDHATRHFQQLHRLLVDGIVGNQTIGAAMVLGFQVIDESADGDDTGPNWPPPPTDLEPLSGATRKKMFGDFRFRAAPTPGNPEGIEILDGWVATNIVTVTIPQLRGVLGANSKGQVSFHTKAAPQLEALFAAWQSAGLLDLVRAWAGSYAPRFVRGSRTELSNHAWGTAFDINAPWNPLGARPALVGSVGSVRKLVPLANAHGFFWGGHYPGRVDGMHFECSRLA